MPTSFSIPRADGIADSSGFPGQGGTIVVAGRNPFSLNDLGFSNAQINDGCSCDTLTPAITNLTAAAHPYHDLMFLFRSKPEQQFAPFIASDGTCHFTTINGLKNTVRFHTIEDGVLDFHLYRSVPDPTATLDRVDLRNITDQALNDLKWKGWEKIFGDQPGYKNGREITFESGKIKNGILSPDVIQKIDLTFKQDGTHLKIDGISNLYVRDIIIYYTDNITAQQRFHLVFKYNFNTSDTCSAANFKLRNILAQETIIDNIALFPSDKTVDAVVSGSPSDVLNDASGANQFVAIDTRYTTGDYIELHGYQPSITKIEAYYLSHTDYHANVLKTDTFAASFDSRGRLFFFYDEEIPFTELPYEDIICKSPSSSSVFQSSSAVLNPGAGGGGSDGGSGGGGSGAAGNVNGIPGGTPTSVTHSSSSSSSSSSNTTTAPGSSSSTSSTSSTSSADKTIPGPPTDAVITEQPNQDGTIPVVVLTWDPPVTSAKVDHYNIYWSLQQDTGFIKIGSVTSVPFIHDSPAVGRWNYYRVTAVNASGGESPYDFLQIFVVPVSPCITRDCMNCFEFNGFQAKNGYTVFFSDFSPGNLAFKCDSCTGGDGFIRILDEGFQNGFTTLQVGGGTKTNDPSVSGVPIPKMFCLLPNCDTDKPASECTWSNTFYMPALISKCIDVGCDSNFEKILIPMTITLLQNNGGWSLDVYGTAPDCSRLPLFKSDSNPSPCVRPTRFINQLPPTGNLSELTTNICGIYPPAESNQYTGTISAAMSPDLGTTWYKFQGLINITNDRKAINPFVTHNEQADEFHLFWIERDFVDTQSVLYRSGTGIGLSGGVAYLKHKVIPARYFREEDAFLNYLPSQSSSSSSTGFDAFAQQQLSKLSPDGRAIRNRDTNTIIQETASTSDGLVLTGELNNAYIDDHGKINLIRFGKSGTLVDPPSRLTRARVRKVTCGNFTWTVSGVTDSDCACKTLVGSFNMVFQSSTASWTSGTWFMQPSADFNYWEISSTNGLAVFHKKRTFSLCPSVGVYELTCDRCLGNMTGTLAANAVQVFADGSPVDNGDFSPSGVNKTNFGSVTAGSAVAQEFVISNNRFQGLIISSVKVVGADAASFTISVKPAADFVPPNGDIKFTLVFRPVGTCGVQKNAEIMINTDAGPYQFNVQGTCQTKDGNTTFTDPTTQDTGIAFSANAVGQVLSSIDGGLTWSSESIADIKTGKNGNAIYDSKANALYVVYVTNGMLFVRRYPSWTYGKQTAELSDLEPKFDGLNIVQPPELIIPSSDVFNGGGIGITLGELAGAGAALGLGVLKVPSNVLSVFQPDLGSIRTPLINEKDPQGFPVFLAGNLYGALFNAVNPYPNSYVFDQKQEVAEAKPALYVTRKGALRFFYVDSKGNINAGLISGELAFLDAKLKAQ
jgi:hypothetical protein